MQRPKILVFAEYGVRNGGENSWLAAAEKLTHQFEFIVACPCPSEFSLALKSLDIQSSDWRLHTDSGDRKTQAQIRVDMQQIIANARPHIVHANSLATSRLAGPVTKALSMPCVGHLRDIIKLSKKAVSDINQCDQIVAVSAATRTFHVGQGISADNCRVIHNGVDLNLFHPSNGNGFVHRELGLAPNTRIILCVGQIGMRKGTDTVIEAFQILSHAIQDLTLVLIGIRNSSKDEAIEFDRRCKSTTKNNDRVRWLNRRSDVANIMQESTLLLHGARQEPLGRVLLESLATGLPFVATNAGGTLEITPNTVRNTDVTCPPNDANHMAKLAETFLTDENLRKQTANRFRLFAEQQFDIHRCATNLESTYLELIRQNPRS